MRKRKRKRAASRSFEATVSTRTSIPRFMMAGVNKIWSSVSWILMTRGCMLTVRDYVCTRGLVSTPTDDKRVYGRVSELGIPWYSLTHDSFSFFLFIANSRRVSPRRARRASPAARNRTRIDNVYYCRAHSIRNNNDLSAIRCKMSARSRGITLSRVPERPMKTFHAPDFGFMISRNFFRPSDKTRGRIIPRQRSNLWSIH